MVYDAVVVGAGPAGSSTAYHLASRGFHVLLLDKKRFPRNKVCGDALTPRAVAAILNMGLAKIGDGRLRISGVRFVEHLSNSEHISSFVDEQPGYGLVIARHELDQLLCKEAITAGAEFWGSAAVLAIDAAADPSVATIRIHIREETLSVRARFAIIAEGSVGTLARTLRRRPLQAAHVGFAVRQYFHIDSPIAPLFEFHFPATFGKRSVAGYGWVFPVSGSLLNIGAGCVRSQASGGNIPVNEVYAEFIERLRGKGRLGPMNPCSPLTGAAVRLGLAPEEMVARRTLVVGDAAALVNPFTGEGIAHALESGELAATAIDNALRKGLPEAPQYAEMLSTRFRRHANLRNSLPQLFGLSRLYDRAGLATKRFSVSSKRTISKCLSSLLQDLDRPSSDPLRRTLLRSALEDANVLRNYQAVDRLVQAEVSAVVPILGEIVFYLRSNLCLIPDYLSTLILVISAIRPLHDDVAVLTAAVTELTALSIVAHSDVFDYGDDISGVQIQINNALSILIGDVSIARLFKLLNHLEAGSAKALSAAARQYAGACLSRRLEAEKLDGHGDDIMAEATFVSDVVRSVGWLSGFDGAQTEELRDGVRHLVSATARLDDTWKSVHANDSGSDGTAPHHENGDSHEKTGQHELPNLRGTPFEAATADPHRRSARDRAGASSVGAMEAANTLDNISAHLDRGERHFSAVSRELDVTLLQTLVGDTRRAAAMVRRLCAQHL